MIEGEVGTWRNFSPPACLEIPQVMLRKKKELLQQSCFCVSFVGGGKTWLFLYGIKLKLWG
jgi:hypothetical protein